jgi:hypothetical protein
MNSLSLGVKRPGSGADHSPPSTAEIKECVCVCARARGAIPPLPNTPSWRGAQLKKHKDNFNFILPWIIKSNDKA